MWTPWQFYAVWLVLVGVIGGMYVRRHQREFHGRLGAEAADRAERIHARARRRRLRRGAARTPLAAH